MALRSERTSPTCSLLRNVTSFTTCSPSKRELRKSMSKSLLGTVPKTRLNPKSVSKLIYRSSEFRITLIFYKGMGFL